MAEIKEPVAIFTAEGFRILLEALKGGQPASLPLETNEPAAAVDKFLEGYYQSKQEDHKPDKPLSKDEEYQLIFDILLDAYPKTVASPEIRKKLKAEGYERDPRGFTAFLNGAMKKYPIEKIGRGLYSAKPGKPIQLEASHLEDQENE